MQRLKYGLLGLAFLFSINSFSQGQLKSFTEDPVKYLEELGPFLETAINPTNKKEIKDFWETFTVAWTTGKINDKYKKAIYKTSNLMLKKRLRALPEFKSYLSSVLNFINSGQPETSFDSWQTSVEKMLTTKAVKTFSDYMLMSEGLFGNNTFYKSATAEWSSSNNKYTFEFDSVPRVVFPSLDLKCKNTHGDSSIVHNTSGIYYPATGKWVGNGGRLDWSRTGLDKNTVYADLKKYTGTMKNASLTADSVMFYNKEYFQTPMPGTLNEKVLPENENAESYPRFESQSKRIQIKSIAENVDYEGGFSMRGAKFVGSGTNEENAVLVFNRLGKPFVQASSKNFTITKEKFLSERTSVKIFIDTCLIYHPDLSLKFNIKEKALTLIRSDEGVSRTPVSNNYHQVDMYFEQLTWKTDEPRMEMKMLQGSSQTEADFESNAYFKKERYDKFMTFETVHPLIRIKEYVKYIGDLRDFYAIDLAKYMKLTVEQVRPLLVQLSTMGFLNYDVIEDKVLVKDKLFQYITARAGKTDYDVIDFHSVADPGTANASLNLLTNDLTIKGVNGILLSDSQNVVIYPRPNQIVLKKDRNFNFAGRVHAGRFDFFGKEFSFDYDQFKVNLKNVDSLRLMVQSDTVNEHGEHPLVRVKTVIENINGDLLIDHPKNKSGVKDFPQYPVFNSIKDSYVFYDKKSIQKGVYNRDNFYFHLEPFTIDSLDNFSNAGLNFKGTFASGDIFPDFKESLTLQKDYSLGFIRETPPGGFALYNGKGKFSNQIKLSNQGLKGDGTINYITSTSKSNEFNFYPDSVNATVNEFTIAEQKTKPEFPQMNAENVYMHWMPKKDIMSMYKKTTPFVCFNKQAEFNGRLDLTPKQLSGDGLMVFSSAELQSRNIKFNSNKFNADTSDFRLKEASELSFSTTNVNAVIDFDKRVGEFKSNGKGSVVNFALNKYICFMDNFKWNIDQQTMDLGSSKAIAKEGVEDKEIELSGPEFISVHPQQDSLRFIAPRARYDLKKHLITAKEVPYIRVADAKIYPDSGFVTIRKDAVMDTLKRAKILANTSTKYHHLYDAKVAITARKKYTGSGTYDYVDEIKNKQPIYFSNIMVDTTFQTYAETNIKDSAHFTLSPNFDYQGTVRLVARDEFLNFNGATRIMHKCEGVARAWLRFDSQINPNKIYIPVNKEAVDMNNDRIFNSVMITNDSTHLYSAFLSGKHAKSDMEVLPADGFLFFDKNSREYRISNKEKLVEMSFPGNYLSFNTSSCKIYGEGRLNLSNDLGQVKMETVGSAQHFLIPDSTAFDLMVSLDFFFDRGALEKMGDAINEMTELKPIDFARPTYEKGLRELMGKEKADKLISQVNLYGSFKKVPDELEKSLVISDLKMKWNSATKSYLSQGKIGLSNIYKNQINKFVDGKIELVKKKGGGDILNIYLELESNKWYFFSYSRGLMQAVSSNEEFNTTIKELKPDKREMKVEKGQPFYNFNLSTAAKKNSFLRKTSNTDE